MGNWYQAILDLDTEPSEAEFFASQLAIHLAEEGIIAARDENDGLITGPGEYIPGPEISKAFGVKAGKLQEANPSMGTIEVHAGPWVNIFGLAGLEQVNCPVCATEFAIKSYDQIALLRDGFSHASHLFCTGDPSPSVRCPVCHSNLPAQSWKTQPHLGFCYLAVLFWNWPPFLDCEVDIPALVSSSLGHKTVLTYGRL